MELGLVATLYIPTSGTMITRAVDIVQNTLSLSTFRVYGSRDYTGARGYRGELIVGPRGEVGPPDNNLNLPPWVSFEQSSTCLSNFRGDLQASRVIGLPAQV